jgi:hypothetical protein
VTWGVAIEVPVMNAVSTDAPCEGARERMQVPGATTSTTDPWLL